MAARSRPQTNQVETPPVCECDGQSPATHVFTAFVGRSEKPTEYRVCEVCWTYELANRGELTHREAEERIAQIRAARLAGEDTVNGNGHTPELADDEIVTLAEAAKRLDRPVRTLKGWYRSGALPRADGTTGRTVRVSLNRARKLSLVRPERRRRAAPEAEESPQKSVEILNAPPADGLVVPAAVALEAFRLRVAPGIAVAVDPYLDPPLLLVTEGIAHLSELSAERLTAALAFARAFLRRES